MKSGAQRPLDLPDVEAQFFNTDSFSTYSEGNYGADHTYLIQLLRLRDVRDLSPITRSRRELLLLALRQWEIRSGNAICISNSFNIATSFFSSSVYGNDHSESYPLIRYLTERTAKFLPEAAFQSQDYANPLESMSLRAWAYTHGLNDQEFSLLLQPDHNRQEVTSQGNGSLSSAFAHLRNASRVRTTASGTQAFDFETSPVHTAGATSRPDAPDEPYEVILTSYQRSGPVGKSLENHPFPVAFGSGSTGNTMLMNTFSRSF